MDATQVPLPVKIRLLTLRYDLICSSVVELGLEPRPPELIEHLCCRRHLVKSYGIEVTALPSQGTYNVLEGERFKTKFQVERRHSRQEELLEQTQGGERWVSFGELKISLEKMGLVRWFMKARNLQPILELVKRLRVSQSRRVRCDARGVFRRRVEFLFLD